MWRFRSACWVFLVVYALVAQTVASPSGILPSGSKTSAHSALLVRDLTQDALLTTYGLAHGLPGLSLNAVEVDGEGRLWIGSASGLYSYDGFVFRAVPAEERALMRGERIRALHRDRQGVLWVGVIDGLLVQCKGGVISMPEGMPRVVGVHSILEASDGSLWFGSSEGLWRRSPTGAFERLNLDGVAFVAAQLAEDPTDGSIYAVSGRGLLRWSGGSQIEKVHGRYLSGLFFDSAGRRWSFSHDGEVFRDGERQFFDATPSGNWLSVKALGDGRQFLGSQMGNFIFSSEDEVPELRRVELDSPVRSLVVGDLGDAWLATSSDGLVLVERREQFLLEPAVQRVGRPVHEAIQVDSERIIVNRSEEDGILLVTAPKGPGLAPQTQFFPSPPGMKTRTHDACLSETGQILLATSTGLASLTEGSIKLIGEVGSPISCLDLGSEGRLWARRDSQLVEMEEDGRLTGRAFESPGRWSETFIVSGHRIYLTEEQRLFECDSSTMEKEELARCEGAKLRSLYLDDENALWMTSYGNGLYRRRADGAIDHWSIGEGLPDRFLGWIGRVPGEKGPASLWMSSNGGAICVSVSSLDAVANGTAEVMDCRSIDSGEGSGIGGGAFSDGTLILPTLAGAVVLRAPEGHPEPVAPRVYLRDVRVNDLRARVDGPLATVGKADLEFFYDVIALPYAHRVQTQSKLIGLDEQWVSGGADRSRRYTNVDEGTYQFAVRARNTTGGWSAEAWSEPITVRRPWYARTQFRIGLAIAILAAGIVGFRFWMGRILARSEVLEAEIARRESAEHELEGQRSQFESVLEGAHDGIFAFDCEGVILYANPAMHWTFGASSFELAGARIDSLDIPGLSDEASLKNLISESAVRQRWKTLEGTARRMSGEEFDLEVSIASDANSDEGCFVGIVRDVSDRKQMLERLRFSEERYRSLYHTAPMAIVVWKPQLRMLEWNQHATDLFGWGARTGHPGASSKDTRLLDLMEGECVTAMRGAIRRVLNGGRDCVETVRTRVAGGSVRNCRWYLAPLMRANGKVWAFISMVLDMSDEDRVASEFKKLRSQLARAEETERARIARELHDDLSQRMIAVAIDLQMNESKISDLGDADLATTFAELRDRVEGVASDVHALSRQLHPTVLDDLGLMSALRSECARRTKRSGVEIHCEGELRPAVEPHGATGLAIFRVVQEALQNAIAHAEASRISVAITEEGDRLELTVEDDGCGFLISHGDHEEAKPRKGIGFASMRERMILVGGELRVSTMLGTGTVVRATVPLQGPVEGPAPGDSAELIPRPEGSASAGVPEAAGNAPDGFN